MHEMAINSEILSSLQFLLSICQFAFPESESIHHYIAISLESGETETQFLTTLLPTGCPAVKKDGIPTKRVKGKPQSTRGCVSQSSVQALPLLLKFYLKCRKDAYNLAQQ